jgi:FAD:protein FMN transferase
MQTAGQIAGSAWEWPATGSTWRIHHAGGVDAAAAQRVANLVAQDEARWSRFQPASEVSRITAGAGRWVRISPETVRLLRRTVDWTDRTGGLFNPLVGGALERWGYAGSLTAGRAFAQQSPRPARVRGRLEVDRDGLRARVPAGTRLDLGGIAKSYMAVRAGALLAELVDDPALLVDAGGDLVAVRGEHIVAVERPGDAPLNLPGQELFEPVCHLRLRPGFGVATSGYGRRQWRNGDGAAAHHLIDPDTGCPGRWAHATVVARDAVQADVVAKCLVLRPLLLEAVELPAMLTVDGVTSATPAWREVAA